jgi:hypothetical protein
MPLDAGEIVVFGVGGRVYRDGLDGPSGHVSVIVAIERASVKREVATAPHLVWKTSHKH